MTDVLAPASVTAVIPVSPRGPLSGQLVQLLGQPPQDDPVAGLSEVVDEALASPDVLCDDDVQLSLFLLYCVVYGSLPQIDPHWEWHPDLLAVRGRLERAFEQRLRDLVEVGPLPEPTRDAVARRLFEMTAPTSGPSLSRFVAKNATRTQLDEFLINRSIYTLREADPHSWAIPRLTGRPKAALVEIQSDEYGAGDPLRMHSAIFAQTMRGAGLDDTYGAHIDLVPAITLAVHNMMSMFGLHRRLRGAIVGHLAAFEMTSSLPNRSYGDGFRRLGFGPDVTWYFDEHVEADAVHEQIAARDLAGSLAEDEPELLEDIVFGAAACLAMDDLAGAEVLEAWSNGRSVLRRPYVPTVG
ncbi:iron-containing redox enzyme family protein [Microbacterium sp. HD4P20]|uniref:iron-containing redox enzyme family protein n=1 Tax=Microbacterium sp. HD4P20 TaxID=2864874 RepID=UPI001C63EBC4|nr:iron-containing redox enzyme family protein [Microbacterium sp. HD4P20]MCP2636238.1 iron-containing redox enzyme family protein [Microbacterium sp. HD4P20]